MNTLTLTTPIIDLHEHSVARLTHAMARKLAMAVANFANKADPTEATVEDLLHYFPMRYEDRSNMLQIDELYDGLEASVELYTRVSGGFQVGKNRKAPPLYIFEISAGDAERVRKPVVIYWFVSGKAATKVIDYYKHRFARGTRFVAYGKWEWDSRRNTFALKLAKPDELEILPPTDALPLIGDTDPNRIAAESAGPGSGETSGGGGESDIEDIDHPEFATIHTGRKVPIYRKLGQFQTKRIREIVSDVLQKLDRMPIKETLPPALIKSEGLITRSQALEEIHFPPESSNLIEYQGFRSPAHLRLIFEEFFWLVFTLALVRGERRKEPKGTVIEITDAMEKRLAKFAPFELTGAQKRVLKRIFADLTGDAPMNRLIQGDVGSGKTIVAFIAALAAMENGYQVAFMAPTEILAEQHARNAKRILDRTNHRVALLKGSMKAAEKRKIHESVANGEVELVIGTHAVIQDAVTFENLGLAVIDEQHRFGVLQRSALRDLGYNPDVLVMTATPIPRSLAMTVYGDLDVSVIDELPPGRTPIKTVVLGEDQRAGVYKGIEREVKLGRQCYVVYPLIEESEKIDLRAATAMFEQLRDHVFPGYRVGLLHGKMKTPDKEAIMDEFVSGKLNILVSTTVIEVGVDVPNASLMVIEHAERFGLSQLHQLRGRVGRGAEQSFCVLLTGDKKTALAKERLGIMEETSDGFRIAEKDLEIRGQGDILGTRQAGVQQFKIGNIIRDFEILERARNAAEEYLGPKRLSDETSKLIEKVKTDPRFHLAGIG